MNFKIYTQKRQQLLDEATELLEEGKVEESNAKQKEIEVLDKEYEDYAKTMANLRALRGTVPAQTDILDLTGKSSANTGNAEGVPTYKSESYASAWAKLMHGDVLNKEDQMVIDTVNNRFENSEVKEKHQLVIPETFRAGIWETAAEEHPVLQEVLPTNIRGDVTIIVDVSENSDADWIDEDEESKDAEVNEDEVNLSGCELSKSITVSWKLKKMSREDYIPYIIRKLGQKVGNAIAKSLFTGKGVATSDDAWKSQAMGVETKIAKEANTPQVVEYDDVITYENLTAAMGRIRSKYKSGLVIYASNTVVWDKLANILDKNGRPIFIPDVTGASVGKIFGVPVKEEDGTSEGSVVFGNYRDAYALNFNEVMTVYTEDHVKARKTDYMAYGIADGDVLDTKAFAVLKKKTA